VGNRCVEVVSNSELHSALVKIVLESDKAGAQFGGTRVENGLELLELGSASSLQVRVGDFPVCEKRISCGQTWAETTYRRYRKIGRLR